MAGDRRATAGNIIAQRDIEKVFAADEHTVVGIAGTAGVALEIVRLFSLSTTKDGRRLAVFGGRRIGSPHRFATTWRWRCRP